MRSLRRTGTRSALLRVMNHGLESAPEQPTDRELQERVLRTLDFDTIEAASIGVSVRHGIVTLLGRVPTTREKWIAERIATAVPGIRAVANDLTVDGGALPTDDGIAEAAANALSWYRAVPADRVHIAVSDGWITLTGSVDDLQQRGAAERAVRQLRGVRGVSNALTIMRAQDLIRPALM